MIMPTELLRQIRAQRESAQLPPAASIAPIAPPSSAGVSFQPPQLQLPPWLPPTLGGGMPGIRSRMLGSVLAPFGQPNWGIPQVNPQYLTQSMPVAGGAIPQPTGSMSKGGGKGGAIAQLLSQVSP